MIYMATNIVTLAIAFILTKQIVTQTKVNLVIITFWVYFFGFCFTFILFLIQASTSSTTSVQNEILNIIFQKQEILGVLLFSCFNEIFNYILLLYLIRKSYVSKAAVYGLLSAIFTVTEGIFYKEVDWLQISEIFLFDIGYFAIAFERRRDKRISFKPKVEKTVYFEDPVEESSQKKKYEEI